MTITINNTEYKVKYTLRALFIFEQITGKPFNLETMLDNYLFFYSLILASNPDNVLEWDDFIDALDNDPTILTQINQAVEEAQKKNDIFSSTDDKGEKKS